MSRLMSPSHYFARIPREMPPASVVDALDRSVPQRGVVRTWSTCRPRVQHGSDRSLDTVTADTRRHRLSRAALADSGAVFVEFLIAFFPVYVFFLCLVQLTLLFSSRLVTEHAAVHAARAAAVVIGDDRARYGGEDPHVVQQGGEREKAIRKAAILTLAPLILTGLAQDVEVVLPEPDAIDGPPQPDGFTYQAMSETDVGKVRVRVEVRVACRIGFANKIACPDDSLTLSSLFSGLRTQRVRAEAIYPYQGARYE